MLETAVAAEFDLVFPNKRNLNESDFSAYVFKELWIWDICSWALKSVRICIQQAKV